MSIVDGCVLRMCSGAEVRRGSLADGADGTTPNRSLVHGRRPRGVRCNNGNCSTFVWAPRRDALPLPTPSPVGTRHREGPAGGVRGRRRQSAGHGEIADSAAAISPHRLRRVRLYGSFARSGALHIICATAHSCVGSDILARRCPHPYVDLRRAATRRSSMAGQVRAVQGRPGQVPVPTRGWQRREIIAVGEAYETKSGAMTASTRFAATPPTSRWSTCPRHDRGRGGCARG
jgi:hypothetical protein